MTKILRRFLIGLGALLALMAVAALALPFLVPMEAYRGRIESAAGFATGRVMHIDGPVRLSIFPHLGLKAQAVTLANVPGGKASVMVEVGDIDLSLQVLPLLSGHIALDKIILNKPTIALEVDPDGNPNWRFGKETAKSEKKGTLTLPSGTAFHGIEITDGTVTYDNAKTRTHRAIEHVNLSVAITTIDKPVSVKGELILAARKLHFEGHLATLQTFLGSGTTDFGLALDADLMKAGFDGQMTPDGTTTATFHLDSPSLRDLSGWLGQKLPEGGLGRLALQGRVTAKEKMTQLDGLKASLDGQTLTGSLSIDSAPQIPVLIGDMQADRLNLTPYLSGGKAQEPAEPVRHGWSRSKISLALIKSFNGRLSFEAGSVHMQSLHLGRTHLVLSLDNGVMDAALDRISLYGGSGDGETRIDIRGPVPLFTSRMRLSGVSLAPFLSDMLHLTSIEGTGAVQLDMSFRGDNANAILHSLNGKGSISAAQGRIKGVDLGQVARTVSVLLGSGATGEVAATDFHAMGASFALQNGVLNTSDFHLAGPVAEMTGQGAIDIGGRGIDFRLRPGAAVGGMRFGVPFRISGSWDKLHYAPDMEALVGGAINNLKNGASAFKGLFDGGQKNGQKPDEKKSVGDKLKNIFGIH